MGVMREEEGGTTACHKLDQDLGGMDFIATHTHARERTAFGGWEGGAGGKLGFVVLLSDPN